MHRIDIIDSIRIYRKYFAAGYKAHASFDLDEEESILGRFMMFIEGTPDCFERSCLPGHVTGSAMVVSADFQHVLLTLHGKLNKWLQLGGHSDGNPLTHEVSLREVEEESGVVPIKVFEPIRLFADSSNDKSSTTSLPQRLLPFDFDYHLIPSRQLEPEHIHYDVRYLVVADNNVAPVISEESKDLRWMPIPVARTLTNERSMHRQFDKVDFLRQSLSETL